MFFAVHLWVCVNKDFPMPFLASARKRFMAYMSTPNHYYVEVYAKEGVTARDAMEREGAMGAYCTCQRLYGVYAEG